MSVEQSVLSNGMRVVTHRMPSVETVSLGVWVGVGTRHETAEVNGASHLLEHMAFKGTKRRSPQAIAEEIENVGGSLNAFTSREITAYHATVLKEDVALAVDIIADILQNSVFDEAELERERAVVLQEIGQSRDTPEDLVFDQFQDAAYPSQPIGRTVLGPPEIVGVMPRGTLVDYMGEHYRAQRMVLVAAGNLTHRQLLELAQEHFAGLSNGGRAVAEPARYRGGDRRDNRDLEQVHLVLGFEGLGYHDPDYYALAVASTLLGGGMSSRLFQEIREKRGLAYSIYSFTSSYIDGGLFGIYAGTGEDGVSELLPVMCGEMAGALRGIGATELQRAKAQLRAGILMTLESTAARVEQLGRQMLIHGRPLPIDEVVQRIEAVDAAAVERVIARLLRSAPTVAAIGPLDKLAPFEDIAGRFSAAA
jgi:predicted Zn-dependent peptidase